MGGLAGFGLVGGGLVRVQAADASKWPKDAFAQKTEADAIKAIYGKSAEESDKVKLDAPEIAENGAVVPISVSSTLADVTSIAILVPENPFPLAAAYKIPAGTSADGGQPPQDGQDQQGRGGGRGRRQALQRNQRGQGHGRRLRRLTRSDRQKGKTNGIDNSCARCRER